MRGATQADKLRPCGRCARPRLPPAPGRPGAAQPRSDWARHKTLWAQHVPEDTCRQAHGQGCQFVSSLKGLHACIALAMTENCAIDMHAQCVTGAIGIDQAGGGDSGPRRDRGSRCARWGVCYLNSS